MVSSSISSPISLFPPSSSSPPAGRSTSLPVKTPVSTSAPRRVAPRLAEPPLRPLFPARPLVRPTCVSTPTAQPSRCLSLLRQRAATEISVGTPSHHQTSSRWIYPFPCAFPSATPPDS